LGPSKTTAAAAGLCLRSMSDPPLVIAPTVLRGAHVRLEPLSRSHIEGLLAAAREDLSLYRWSTIPASVMEMAQYVDAALAARDEGSALPFAAIRIADGAVVGSTRFFLIERWAWPAGHTVARPVGPDGC